MSEVTGTVYTRQFRDAPLLRPQLVHALIGTMTNPADDEFLVVGKIPAGARIIRVTTNVTDAFAAGDEFNLGLWGEDGAAIDADGLIANGGVTTQTLGVEAHTAGVTPGVTISQNVEIRAQYLGASNVATAGVITFIVEYASAEGRFTV